MHTISRIIFLSLPLFLPLLVHNSKVQAHDFGKVNNSKQCTLAPLYTLIEFFSITFKYKVDVLYELY